MRTVYYGKGRFDIISEAGPINPSGPSINYTVPATPVAGDVIRFGDCTGKSDDYFYSLLAGCHYHLAELGLSMDDDGNVIDI